MKMRYIGEGGFVAGVPARDLSAVEVEKYGKAFLLSTGLYQEVKTIKQKRAVKPKPVTEDNND